MTWSRGGDVEWVDMDDLFDVFSEENNVPGGDKSAVEEVECEKKGQDASVLNNDEAQDDASGRVGAGDHDDSDEAGKVSSVDDGAENSTTGQEKTYAGTGSVVAGDTKAQIDNDTALYEESSLTAVAQTPFSQRRVRLVRVAHDYAVVGDDGVRKTCEHHVAYPVALMERLREELAAQEKEADADGNGQNGQEEDGGLVHDIPRTFIFPPKPTHPARDYSFTLDPFQQLAVSCIDRNESVMVAAHTSAGKTAIAEYAIAMALGRGERVVYTSPIKALSNQKFKDLREIFGEDQVGLITGDTTVSPSHSCLVMTTEILRSMLYRGDDSIRAITWVVFDEVHYMKDAERGVVWEETIILLPDKVRYAFLSATLPNAPEFSLWVAHVHNQICHVVTTEFRPTPLEHFVYPVGGKKLELIVDAKGNFHEDAFARAVSCISGTGGRLDVGSNTVTAGAQHAKSGRQGGARQSSASFSTITKVCLYLMSNRMNPVIVFSFSKRECEEYAMALQARLRKGGADKTMRALRSRFGGKDQADIVRTVYNAAVDRLQDEVDKSLPQIKGLLPLLECGIGFHHAGMLPILKEVTELLFAEGVIQVLFATETFAMGINMPARTVLFTSVQKFDGTRVRLVQSGEYIQMSGRAGRRGTDKSGLVVLCLDSAMEPHDAKTLMMGHASPLMSQFRIRYNMMLSMMRLEGVNPHYVLQRSLRQFQMERRLPLLRGRMMQVEVLERQMVEQIEQVVAVASNGAMSVDELGEYVGYLDEIENLRELLRRRIQRIVHSSSYVQRHGCGMVVWVTTAANGFGPMSSVGKATLQGGLTEWGWGVLISWRCVSGPRGPSSTGKQHLAKVLILCDEKGAPISPSIVPNMRSLLRYALDDVIGLPSECEADTASKGAPRKDTDAKAHPVADQDDGMVPGVDVVPDGVEGYQIVAEVSDAGLHEGMGVRDDGSYEMSNVEGRTAVLGQGSEEGDKKGITWADAWERATYGASYSGGTKSNGGRATWTDGSHEGVQKMLSPSIQVRLIEVPMRALYQLSEGTVRASDVVVKQSGGRGGQAAGEALSPVVVKRVQKGVALLLRKGGGGPHALRPEKNIGGDDNMCKQIRSDMAKLEAKVAVTRLGIPEAVTRGKGYLTEIWNAAQQLKRHSGVLRMVGVKKANGCAEKAAHYPSRVLEAMADPRVRCVLLYRRLRAHRKLKVVLEEQVKANGGESVSATLGSMVDVLKKLEYVDSKGIVTEKGHVACEINTQNELILTELLFAGVFSSLDVPSIGGLLLCLLKAEGERPAKKKTTKGKGSKSGADSATVDDKTVTLREAFDRMVATVRRVGDAEVACGGIKSEEDVVRQVDAFDADTMQMGVDWLNGKSFESVTAKVDFEGDIIRLLRRLDRLLRELHGAAHSFGDPELMAKFSKAIEANHRGLPFTQSLYL